MNDISPEAKRKYDILQFWYKHGLAATTEAFGVSRRSLYAWKKLLKDSSGNLHVLDNASRAPKTVRKRSWDSRIISEIERIRHLHPNLGKEKIHIFLKPFCKKQKLTCPSIRTIGRLIADAPDKMRRIPQKVSHFGKVTTVRKKPIKQRKPKGFKAEAPGHCIGLDTIELQHAGVRRYILTAVDIYSRNTYSFATHSHSSKTAGGFLNTIQKTFPHTIQKVLTDNGSEFMKDFEAELTKDPETTIIHWHTYPRTPKMNAHAERFNRTVQEEFVQFHQELLFSNLPLFNKKLQDYTLWYNTQRPHFALGLKTPKQVLEEYNKQQECNM